MENGEVVNEAPAPSIEEQMVSHLENSENEESQSSDTDGETIEEPGSDTEQVEAQDEQEESEWVDDAAEEPQEEVIPKAAFTKRINSLQAARRRAESHAEQLDMQQKQYELMFSAMKDRLNTSEKKLAEYVDSDPRDHEIRQMRLQHQMRELEQRQQQQLHHKRVSEHQDQVVTERADEIIDTADNLAEKYNTFSSEELVIAFSKSDDVSLDDLAKNIHGARLKTYRKHLARGKPNDAPKPIRTQGAQVNTSGNSSDDMVAFLESISGEKR
jgi:hypothetical protein